MPELPVVVVYIEALERVIGGQRLEGVRVPSPFVVRSVDPPISELHGCTVTGVHRQGKRIVIGFDADLFAVIHLMIAGRLRWKKRGARPPRRNGLACFDFAAGTLLFTEAGTRKRASLHIVRGSAELAEHQPGGLEILESDVAAFARVLRAENHTVKRSLTDPHIISGVGNAYSDEILHRARLSPAVLTQRLDDMQIEALFDASVAVLREWTDRLRDQAGENFPDKVTAFHAEMSVHGKFREPCPVCDSPVQRIVYAANESNYCARCQTGGKLLSDRALARLLKKDWPKTIDELEQRLAGSGKPAAGD